MQPATRAQRQMISSEPPAEFSYGLHQRTFAPLPKSDPRHRRVQEIRRFRVATSGGGEQTGRPCWNRSAKDEAHPFPQRASMHSVSHYDGVEVVDTHFPASVKGTTAMRIAGDPLKKSGVWTANQSRAKGSHRHTFKPESGEWDMDGEGGAARASRLSYLSTVIIDENTADKRQMQQGWCGIVALPSNFARRHVTSATEHPHYFTELNKTKPELTAARTTQYVTPKQSFMRQYRQQLKDGTLRAAAQSETPLTLYERPDAPAVFTMSNVDRWWGLDPVQVAAEQTARKETLRQNPYSSFGGTGQK